MTFAVVMASTTSVFAQSFRAAARTDERSANNSWSQFRGGPAQGRIDRTLPTQWSGNHGIRWKTALPGHGHSSPIVFGDHIYVTTAAVEHSGASLDTTLRYVSLGAIVILCAIVMSDLASRCHPVRCPTSRDLCVAIGLASAVLALAIIDITGDALFDFRRCNIRGWLTSTVFASVCLALMAASANHRGYRVAIGLSAIVFAAFVLTCFPSKDFAFRGGVSSLRMQISIAASAVPFLVGSAIVFAARRPVTGVIARRVAAAAVGAILLMIAALLLRHLIMFRDGAFPEKLYVPQVSRWWLTMPFAAMALDWLLRRARMRSLLANIAIVWLGAVSIVLVGAVAVEFVATRSFYLAYQVGEPKLEPMLTTGPLWSAAGVSLATTVWVLCRSRARTDSLETSATALRKAMPVMLSATMLVLAAVYFARVNYVSTDLRMFRAIVSLDRQSGGVEWMLRGLEGPQAPTDGRNSAATPTPATDGTIVCAYFGSPGLMCADIDGRLVWSRTDIGYEGFYGAAFSPVLADGLLVVANDQGKGRASVQALDVKSGATRWRRDYETVPTITGNNRTPIVHDVSGKRFLIVWGRSFVKALSLASGATAWEYPIASDGDLVSSAIMDQAYLYLSDHTGTTALDFTSLTTGREPLLWKNGARANCASPVMAQMMIFTVTDAGIATAQRADTGEILWRQRLGGQYFASPVASPDAVYFTNSDGVTSVVAAEPKFRLIATNDLQEEVVASMASSDGELYIRSAAHLYAVGSPRPRPR